MRLRCAVNVICTYIVYYLNSLHVSLIASLLRTWQVYSEYYCLYKDACV